MEHKKDYIFVVCCLVGLSAMIYLLTFPSEMKADSSDLIDTYLFLGYDINGEGIYHAELSYIESQLIELFVFECMNGQLDDAGLKRYVEKHIEYHNIYNESLIKNISPCTMVEVRYRQGIFERVLKDINIDLTRYD